MSWLTFAVRQDELQTTVCARCSVQAKSCLTSLLLGVVGQSLWESHHTHYSCWHSQLTWRRDRSGGEVSGCGAQAGEPVPLVPLVKAEKERSWRSLCAVCCSVAFGKIPPLWASLNFARPVSHLSAHPSHHAAAAPQCNLWRSRRQQQQQQQLHGTYRAAC